MADSGEGPGVPAPSLIFRPNWGPKGRKIFFGDWANPKPLNPSPPPSPPALSQGLNPVLNSIILVLALSLVNLINKNKYCWWNNSQIKEDVQFHLSQN